LVQERSANAAARGPKRDPTGLFLYPGCRSRRQLADDRCRLRVRVSAVADGSPRLMLRRVRFGTASGPVWQQMRIPKCAQRRTFGTLLLHQSKITRNVSRLRQLGCFDR